MPKKPFPPDVAALIVDRAALCCEAMIVEAGCTFKAQHIHHRKMRSQGGGHTPSNCVLICYRCHDWIHKHPAVSYERGFLVRGHKDETAQVFMYRLRPVLLDERGGIQTLF